MEQIDVAQTIIARSYKLPASAPESAGGIIKNIRPSSFHFLFLLFPHLSSSSDNFAVVSSRMDFFFNLLFDSVSLETLKFLKYLFQQIFFFFVLAAQGCLQISAFILVNLKFPNGLTR